jgi:uncharacterized protein (TIGR03435 family)
MERLRGLRFAGSIAIVFAGIAGAAGFDVASVRPNATGVSGSSVNRSGGRITLENVSLRECIGFAFGIATGRDYEFEGPGWLDDRKFDITATFPPETSRGEVREMLRMLLAERFRLKTHYESRALNSYALVVGKGGSKLQAGSAGTDGAFIYGEGHVTVRAMSMASLADRLSGPVFRLGRPVLDRTGITGVFDFTLHWAPEDAPPEGRSDASIFVALQEQLGLRLERRRVVSRILVVDHAEKMPAEN